MTTPLDTVRQALEECATWGDLPLERRLSVRDALQSLTALEAQLAREPVSLAKCKWEISKVLVPGGVWNIEEGMKMERAVIAVLDHLNIPHD